MYSPSEASALAIKHICSTGKERRITRWEHEHILDAVQRRLDEHSEKTRQRRETVEHPFGTIKARMGFTLLDEDAATGCRRDGLRHRRSSQVQRRSQSRPSVSAGRRARST